MELGILIPTLLIHLLLGIAVLARKPQSATHRLFFLLSFLIIAWAAVNYVSLHPPSLESALFWIRLVLFFAAPLSVSLFLFVATFPQDTLPFSRTQLFSIAFLTALTMVVALSPFLFTKLETSPGGMFRPQPGPGMALFIPVGIGSLIAAMVLLAKKFVSAKGIVRNQLRLLLIGASLFWGLIVGTIFIPVVFFNYSGLVSFSPVWSLAFSGATTYAIARHRFLDIRIVAAAALVIALILLLGFRTLSFIELQDLILGLFSLLGTAVIGYFLVRSVIREISQREKIESLAQELTKANERLRQLDAAKTEFVSLTSHQIRTPLTVMRGFLSMVFEGRYGAVPETLKSVLQKTYDANERLVKLIADLLNISRIESGKLIFEKEPTDLAALTKSVVDELSQTAQAKRLALTFEASPGLPQVSLDATRFRQVVLNLIDNAIKYTEQGRVAVRVVSDKKAVVLSVEDTGRGMTEEDAQHIFGKFERGIEVPRVDVEGVGLGLYLARKIVEAHGGAISASTAGPGKGSTFTVTLPL